MKRKSPARQLNEAIDRLFDEKAITGEYGEGLPESPDGYYWVDSDGPIPGECEIALDSSGHIWVLAPKR